MQTKSASLSASHLQRRHPAIAVRPAPPTQRIAPAMATKPVHKQDEQGKSAAESVRRWDDVAELLKSTPPMKAHVGDQTALLSTALSDAQRRHRRAKRAAYAALLADQQPTGNTPPPRQVAAALHLLRAHFSHLLSAERALRAALLHQPRGTVAWLSPAHHAHFIDFVQALCKTFASGSAETSLPPSKIIDRALRNHLHPSAVHDHIPAAQHASDKLQAALQLFKSALHTTQLQLHAT